jgi:hypothetical protein
MPSAADGSGTSLKPDDALEVMAAWTEPRFLRLPWHRTLELRLKQAARGESSLAVIGDQGTGKTQAVKRFLPEVGLDDEGAIRGPWDGNVPGSPCFFLTMSRADGRKTALVNVLEGLREGIPVSASELRRFSPSVLLDQVVGECRDRGHRLICLDEAQMMDASNLDQVRLLTDRSTDAGYPIRMCLVGTGSLAETLSRIGQRGQRVAWEIHVKPLQLAEFHKNFTGFHPLLGDVEASMEGKDWRALVRHLYQRTRGKLRRIKDLLQGANALGLQLNEPLDADHLTRTANDLPPE